MDHEQTNDTIGIAPVSNDNVAPDAVRTDADVPAQVDADPAAAHDAVEPKAASSDWPRKGASADDEQPWESEDHDVHLVPGYPILTSGSADATVIDLAQRLNRLGYANSVTEGENPMGIVDASVLGAVRAFRRDYGVREDPSGFQAVGASADAHIGPWTSTAIVLASDRQDA